MNNVVEITSNQFQQNISIKLLGDYSSTFLTGNIMKFPVDLTKIFNSVFIVYITTLSFHCDFKLKFPIKNNLICKSYRLISGMGQVPYL